MGSRGSRRGLISSSLGQQWLACGYKRSLSHIVWFMVLAGVEDTQRVQIQTTLCHHKMVLVEKMFNVTNLDLLSLKRPRRCSKSMSKPLLIDAIASLAYASDRDSDGKQDFMVY